MAEYYDSIDPDETESKPKLRHSSDAISLIELAVRFLRWTKENRTSGTWRTYRDGLKRVTRPYKTHLACELRPADVEELKSKMIADGYAARTINIMVLSVKRLYTWAVKQALLEDNPLAGVERVGRNVNAPEHPRAKHLTLEKALRCVELCRESPPLGDLCEFMLLTGMRVGEVVRIRWDDVDLDERMLRLERHKTSGMTGRPRVVPLCDRIVEILRGYASDGLDAGGPVFRGQGGRELTVAALQLRLRRLRKKHKKLEDFSFHKLRHTCATYLARQKVPERVAQAILGHSSTLMTRYYTATDPAEMIEAVEKLSAAAGKKA